MDTYRYALTPVDMQVEYAKLEHDFQTLPESWRKEPQEDLVHALSEMVFVFTSSFESKIHQHYYGTLDNEADETRYPLNFEQFKQEMHLHLLHSALCIDTESLFHEMSNEFPGASVIEPKTQRVTILHILEDGLFKALMARGMAYAAQKGLMSAQKLEIIPEAALTQEYVLNISRSPYEVQVPKLRKMVRHHITQLTSDLYSLKEAEAILGRAFDIEKGANFFIESINGLLDKIEKSIGSAHALFMESNNLASYSRSAYFSQSIAYNFPESLLRHLGFGYSDFCGLENFETMDMEAMTVHIMRHDLREMIFENAQKMISFGSSFEDHELEESFWESVG